MQLVTTFCKYCKGVSVEEAHASCLKAVEKWRQPTLSIEELIARHMICPACLTKVSHRMSCPNIGCSHFYANHTTPPYNTEPCSVVIPCKACWVSIRIAMKKIWNLWLESEIKQYIDTRDDKWYALFYPYYFTLPGSVVRNYVFDMDTIADEVD